MSIWSSRSASYQIKCGTLRFLFVLLFLIFLFVVRQHTSMAAGAVAVNVVSSAITGSLEQLFLLIKDQKEYQTGAKGLLKTLKQHLTEIQAAINSASKLQINNPGLQHWLKDFEDAAEAAKKVLDKSPGKFELSKFCKRLVYLDEDLNELKNVVKRFQKIAAHMGDFLKGVELDLFARTHREMLGWQQTTSMPMSKMFGHGGERERRNGDFLFGDYG